MLIDGGWNDSELWQAIESFCADRGVAAKAELCRDEGFAPSRYFNQLAPPESDSYLPLRAKVKAAMLCDLDRVSCFLRERM